MSRGVVGADLRLEAAQSKYRGLLETYLGAPGELELSHAYSLGRELMAAGVSILELAALHHEALAAWLRAAPPAQPSAAIAAAGRLFGEALAGYEMLLRGYGEANTALRGMNERMEKQIAAIALALHDESGQMLAAVMIRLDQALAGQVPEPRAEIQAARTLLDQVELQLRRLAHELHPALLTELGLQPALEFLADGVGVRGGVAIRLEGRLDRRWPPPVEICLYRCVQECLNNAVRHARARTIRIQLQAGPAGIEIEVGDDGRGFDPARARHGLGLVGMRERLRGVGGELELRTQPGAGAAVRLRVPANPDGGGYALAAITG